jgi:heat shock protein HslJ
MAAVVLSVAVAVWVSGCTKAPSTTDPGTLEGVEWALVGTSISSTDLSAMGVTATFDGERVSGFSAVNQYGGPYTARSDGSLDVGELTSTLIAGPEPLMSVESAYLELLGECDSYAVKDGRLTLFTDGNETLIFEERRVSALYGSWVVTFFNDGIGGMRAPSEDSSLTVAFGTDGRVTGSAGVNRFTGSYESAESTLAIGPFALTDLAGTPELTVQETAYLQALGAAVVWRINRDNLELSDAQGVVQVIASPLQ